MSQQLDVNWTLNENLHSGTITRSGSGTHGAQYVINATEGCADITVTLPAPLSILRIDHVDYQFDHKSKCLNTLDESDTIDCSLTDDGEGNYQATARICDVEKHVWAGFLIDDYLQHKFHSYITVYFTQGGTYANIENNCIQPQLSSPAEIDAVGLSQVEIVCARHDKCAQGPYVSNTKALHYLSILIINNGAPSSLALKFLCNDYSSPKCKTEMKGEIRLLKTTLKRIADEDKNYVFCSTLDSFLSYIIHWS
ncbi:hypothetical protein Aperf_G00000040994 [Anoplocephala perfoliata]